MEILVVTIVVVLLLNVFLTSCDCKGMSYKQIIFSIFFHIPIVILWLVGYFMLMMFGPKEE